MDNRNLDQISKFLEEIIVKTGNYVAQNKTTNTTYKTGNDIVTNVDIQAEKLIIDSIKNNFPGDKIIAEESENNGESDWQWIIDPIDGTINFASGLPFYTVSVALQYKHQTVLGGVYVPDSEELYLATIKSSSTMNGQPIRVSNTSTLRDSLISVSLNADFNKNDKTKTLSIINSLLPQVRGTRIFVSGALELCFVACGKLDAKLRIKSNNPDYSSEAGVLIVKQAQGKVTNLIGHEYKSGDSGLIASNGILHSDLLSEIVSI